MLVEYGCDSAQGYLFSRPLPAPELTAWLTESEVGATADALCHPGGRHEDPRHGQRGAPRRGARAGAARRGARRRRARRAGVRHHDRGRLDRRPRLRARVRAGRRRRPARRDAAQAPRRLPRAAGLRRHERHRHAQPARGGGRGGRRPLRVHEHDERVRARADPAAGRAGRVDHRGRDAGPAQHLRRDQDRRRGPLRARPPRPRPAVPDPAHLALLPRGGRSRRRPGEPTTTRTSRSTSCSTAGSTSRTW